MSCNAVTRIPRDLLKETAKATTVEHVKVVMRCSDQATATTVTDNVVKTMHVRYRKMATRRIEETIVNRCVDLRLHHEGQPVADTAQLNKYCRDLCPQKCEHLWQVFFGMEGYQTHGATTWEREVLTSQGVEYIDDETKPIPDGVNHKFGKPTKVTGGFLMKTFSTVRSVVHKRTIQRQSDNDFRVANSLPAVYDEFKRLRRGVGFCAALHITYKKKPLAHYLKIGGPNDVLKSYYIFHKANIEGMNFEVHQDFDVPIVPSQVPVLHLLPVVSTLARVPVSSPLSALQLESVSEHKLVVTERRKDSELDKQKTTAAAMAAATTKKATKKKKTAAVAPLTMQDMVAIVSTEQAADSIGEDKATDLVRMQKKDKKVQN